jgi:uncharacterized protein (DUF58 family)
MISEELLKKVRHIEIRTKYLVNTLFSGEYKSSFKGRGIEFLDVREYQPGDDVRTIDWKVTARMGRPFVKKYAEERELSVILVVDASGSGHFGTRVKLKMEQAAEVAATLAFSAIRNNDKVGLLFFTDKVEKFIPPMKGRFHVLRLIRDILYFEPEGRGTDPVNALEYLMHVLKRRSIVFFVSDFLGKGFDPEVLRTPLGVAARRHDLIAVDIKDPAESVLPSAGFVELEDAETGETALVNTWSSGLRRAFKEHAEEEQGRLDALFLKLGIDRIRLSTDEDFTPVLHRFFQMRAKRFR